MDNANADARDITALGDARHAVSAPERPHPDAALGDLHKWVTFRSAWVLHFSPGLDRRWLISTMNSCAFMVWCPLRRDVELRNDAWWRLRCAGVGSSSPRVKCSAERKAGEAEDDCVANNANRAQSEHVGERPHQTDQA